MSLKLRQAGHHGQHQAAARCSRVDTEVENPKMHAAAFQVLGPEQDACCRAAQPADFGHHQRVAGQEPRRQPFELGALAYAGCPLAYAFGRTGPVQGIDLPLLILIAG